jgi:hypothetical protein
LLAGSLFLVLFVAVLVICWRTAARRNRALAALAAELGWEFSEHAPFDIPGRFGHLDAINRSGKASNVLRGEHHGRRATAFDYAYATSSSQGGSLHTSSALVVTLDCRFPHLLIRPEDLLDKAAGAAGREDIDFESREFSSKYCVQSSDHKFAYGVITPQMMEALLRDEGWSIELGGSEAIIHTGEVWKPAEFRSAIAVLEGFLDLIPGYVWKDYAAKEAIPDARA